MRYTFFAVLVLSVSCSGELFFGDSDLRVSDKNGSFQNGDVQNKGPGINPLTGEPDPTPIFPEPDPDNLHLLNAGTGLRCNSGTKGDYLVLSDLPASCEVQAQAIDAYLLAESTPGIVVFESDELNAVKRYCFTATALGCEDVSFSVDRNGAKGSWSATITGKAITQAFDVQDCDFDTALPPLNTELPATDLSITEVSFYQGVKIPVFANGQFITDRQAPLIAKRPGVVRVFIEPQPGWAPREILARLTVGEFTKEVLFTPTVVSSEMIGSTTINFDLLQDELPGTGNFSVSLFEVDQCTDRPPGTPAVSSVPAVLQELDAKTLAAPMNIMLVPMTYNADGSGRTPIVDANVVKAFQELASEYYPVHQVNLTVRDQQVPYDGVISRNGAGFSQALNFCLNQRALDNVAADVYYYCMYQPANSIQEFCGGGCVAGIAPVPPANSVGLRGGMGISFNGSGADTFIHEVGHSLGRPHSPCGGAAGADPNYPYQGGSIGSIGYSIISGQLVLPAQAKDFMGYCNPVWISDYTYARIYDRLSQVLGLQQSQFLVNPVTWKTAILDLDGSLKWDIDRTMKSSPGGTKVFGDVFDLDDKKVGSVEVFVLPLADIESSILTIEDPGFSGGRIEIPNVGTLNF